MNFLHLKYFLAVCELGTVSAAADFLHIAQPSLSLAIKELENEFGAQLFQRTHKGMLLTDEGRLLLGMGKDIMERAEDAEREMRKVGRNRKALKLGMPPMIGSLILPILYRDFLSRNPDLELTITECGKEETLKQLREDDLDVAFISHSSTPDPDLDFFHLGSLEIVCGVSPRSGVARHSVLTPGDLEGVPLVMYKDGFFQTREVKNWFSGHHIEPNVLLKTNQLSTLVRLISSNTAVGFLFRKLAEAEPDIKSIPIAPPITAHISLVTKKTKIPFLAMKSLKGFLHHANLFEGRDGKS